MKKCANARLQRQQSKKACYAAQRQGKKRLTAPAKSRGKTMVRELFRTINHFSPTCSNSYGKSKTAGADRTMC